MPNPKILLLGGSGQLGADILKTNTKNEIIAPPRAECDIADYKSLSGFWDKNPEIDLVINAAAFTDVAGAEIRTEEAASVNEEGAGYIARQCRLKKVPLIHLSTDYVFDGAKKGAYVETDPVRPINVYGQTKVAGEEAIRRQIENSIILRTSWIFGAQGKNFLKTIVSLAREKQEIDIVKDQIGCPTPSDDLAEAVLKISDRILETPQSVLWGTYHYAGTPAVSWFDFATEIVRQAKEREICPLSVKVKPVTSDAFPSPVKRPSHSELSSGKIEKNFGVGAPDWKSGVSRALASLFASA